VWGWVQEGERRKEFKKWCFGLKGYSVLVTRGREGRELREAMRNTRTITKRKSYYQIMNTEMNAKSITLTKD
jgi:hypothetical protein